MVSPRVTALGHGDTFAISLVMAADGQTQAVGAPLVAAESPAALATRATTTRRMPDP